ncbi:MAG: hypothetical protein ACK559_10035, partial [bacterium]
MRIGQVPHGEARRQRQLVTALVEHFAEGGRLDAVVDKVSFHRNGEREVVHRRGKSGALEIFRSVVPNLGHGQGLRVELKNVGVPV